jgi:hypothetical protein
VRLTSSTPSVCLLSAQTSHNPMGLHGLFERYLLLRSIIDPLYESRKIYDYGSIGGRGICMRTRSTRKKSNNCHFIHYKFHMTRNRIEPMHCSGNPTTNFLSYHSAALSGHKMNVQTELLASRVGFEPRLLEYDVGVLTSQPRRKVTGLR